MGGGVQGGHRRSQRELLYVTCYDNPPEVPGGRCKEALHTRIALASSSIGLAVVHVIG